MTDKSKHFIAGLLVALALRPWLGVGSAVIGAAVAGAAKEVWDVYAKGDVSMADFGATLVGGVIVEIGFLAYEGI